MNERSEVIAMLIIKHLQGTLNEQERKELDDWKTASEQNSRLFKKLTDEHLLSMAVQHFNDDILEEGRKMISQRVGFEIPKEQEQEQEQQQEQEQEQEQEPVHPISWQKYLVGAAATIAAAAIIGLVWNIYRKQPSKEVEQATIELKQPSRKMDLIRPGGNSATLLLADSSKLVLPKEKNGLLAQQGSAQVYEHNNELVYKTPSATRAHQTARSLQTVESQKPIEDGKTADPEKLIYNRLSTGPNENFKVQLPDGSKVWLNATSSVSYPVSGSGRSAIVTGEAYFEIEKNPGVPFVVMARNVEIKVLGTRFNINTNKDDSIQTSLLEGVVILTKGDKSWRLPPGQQATTSYNGPENEMIMTPIQDSSEIVGWKNGELYFNGANIRTLMGKIADWYNVAIEYKGDLKGVDYTGHFSSSLSIQELLKQLDRIDIHAELNGRTITVSPKHF